MIFRKRYIRFFYLVILLAACSAESSNTTANIQGYDYTRMKQIELEHPLKEISGIAWADSNSFIAINDEKGIIYALDPQTFRIANTYAFGEAGDYEEIQVHEKTIYVLRSDGTIYKINFDSTVEILSYTGAKAEYESFYVDTQSNTLVLIPKQSKNGTKEKKTISYTINAMNGMHIGGTEHILNWNDLKSNIPIHPSAAAVHPVTKDIYLLASIEKRLVVLNASWKVVAEYELDRKYFQQPEGITFDIKGNIYITNEGDEGSPTIIQIPILSK